MGMIEFGELSSRTPISFLFFAASAVAGYYAIDNPDVRWFAIAAFCFFIAHGPSLWLQKVILSLQQIDPSADDPFQGRSVRARCIAHTTGWTSGLFQVFGFLAGVGYGIKGLVAVY